MPKINIKLTRDQIDVLYSLLNEQEDSILMMAVSTLKAGNLEEAKRLLENANHYGQIRAELAAAWQGVQA